MSHSDESVRMAEAFKSQSISDILASETHDFVVKAGGPQIVGAGGMVRSSAEGKTDFSLPLDGAMFQRWADHLTKATRPPANYPKRNWLRAREGTPDERRATMERARESAVRHFIQWYRGDLDEDHAAAVFFNINVHETVKETL